MSVPGAGDAILEVRDVVKHFPVLRGILRRPVGAVRALDGITFGVREGETLGLVGESGSGKSTAARVVLGLERPTAGSVRFRGEEVGGAGGEGLGRIRREMQMIFQDPYASLNPRMTVGEAVAEPLRIHRIASGSALQARVEELLGLVGLDAAMAGRYPHEFSGGQRQRVGIARALATGPRLLVADEPISALDVSIQAQIVNLLGALKEELGLTYLFIAHDLAMVRHISDRVAVLYLGRLAELGRRERIFAAPRHPYTRALLAAIPVADPDRAEGVAAGGPPGEAPDPAHPPTGCRFHPRCPFATDLCRAEEPVWRNLGEGEGPEAEHWVACHHAETLP